MIDAIELSLVLDLVIPPKFKVLDFTKNGGTSCPKKHLTMYCRKMVGYIKNEKLLINYFQDSLTGYASEWNVQLDCHYIRSWKDLTKAFVAHYKHVIDTTLNRLSLQNLK